MRIKQREANRKALVNAAALIEVMDLLQLFDDYGDSDDADENEHNYAVLDKAQRNAVKRIRSLIGDV